MRQQRSPADCLATEPIARPARAIVWRRARRRLLGPTCKVDASSRQLGRCAGSDRADAGAALRADRCTTSAESALVPRAGASPPYRAGASRPIRARAAIARPLRVGRLPHRLGTRRACLRRARPHEPIARGSRRTRSRDTDLGSLPTADHAAVSELLRVRRDADLHRFGDDAGIVRPARARLRVSADAQRRASASPGVASSSGGIVRSPASASARVRASRQAPASASA